MSAILALQNRLAQLDGEVHVPNRVRQAVLAALGGEIPPSKAWEVIHGFEASRQRGNGNPRKKAGPIFTTVFRRLPDGVKTYGSRVIAKPKGCGEVYHVAAGKSVPPVEVPLLVQKTSVKPILEDRSGNGHFIVAIIRPADPKPAQASDEEVKRAATALAKAFEVAENGNGRKPEVRVERFKLQHGGRMYEPLKPSENGGLGSANMLTEREARRDPTIDWGARRAALSVGPSVRGVYAKGTRKPSASQPKVRKSLKNP